LVLTFWFSLFGFNLLVFTLWFSLFGFNLFWFSPFVSHPFFLTLAAGALLVNEPSPELLPSFAFPFLGTALFGF
jgi:hypothetical protein